MANGKASPRCDFENTIGTVQFAAGETSKTLSVAIVDDAYAEGNETFTINLSNPVGGVITDSQGVGTSNGPMVSRTRRPTIVSTTERHTSGNPRAAGIPTP